MIDVTKQLKLVVFLMAATASTSLANTPPPPVNQNMGIPDSTFNNLVEANCRGCHEDQTIVNPGTIPDRHHLLVNTGPLPNPTAAPYGSPGDATYQCLTCHHQEWDPTIQGYVFETFRDCLHCHKQIPNEGSVHHLTAKAKAENCKACHGPIDNPGDGHYIPTYNPSLVTPHPSGKPNAGPNGEGQCTFCHDSGLDMDSGRNILTNQQTHHGTGLGINASGPCEWCHDIAATTDERIRRCEACHGVASLHNIQVDSDNPANIGTVVSGEENPYWGHIGSNDDCYGCHGFSALSAAAPYSGPVIPNITEINVSGVFEGTAVDVTITGTGFTNTIIGVDGSDIVLTSTVVLTAVDGTKTELAPTFIDETSLNFTLPATLSPGNYRISLQKADKISNAVNLSVLPVMTARNVTCRGNSVIIKGTGFSEYVNALDSGTGIVAVDRTGSMIDCTVRNWNDTRIAATCSGCPSNVTVNSIWGQASSRTRNLRSRR